MLLLQLMSEGISMLRVFSFLRNLKDIEAEELAFLLVLFRASICHHLVIRLDFGLLGLLIYKSF